MSQNLQNFVKFQKIQLENLVDFEKCCKSHHHHHCIIVSSSSSSSLYLVEKEPSHHHHHHHHHCIWSSLYLVEKEPSENEKMQYYYMEKTKNGKNKKNNRLCRAREAGQHLAANYYGFAGFPESMFVVFSFGPSSEARPPSSSKCKELSSS